MNFLITNKNLKKLMLMLKDFQGTFQSLLNHYRSNFHCYKNIKAQLLINLKIIMSICNY